MTEAMWGSGRVYSSAAAFQEAHAGLDSIRVETPLPGVAGEVVRFLLTKVPQWLQLTGLVVGLVVGIVVAWFLISRRKAIWNWLVTRPTPLKIGLGVGAAVLLIGAAGAGAATWNYTQHSNDFCQGCHVMDGAIERMTGGKSKHAKLACHDCHQQPITASMWQLYLWVKERPEEINKHANVPNKVCENCHVTQDTAQWQRIASTAGHRVHLESDSLPLKDIQCIECHGTELHAFQPVKETCGQSSCHKPADTDIVLGKMAEQTQRHCTSCHEFTAAVPDLATTDSANATLIPGEQQCFSCHEMRKVLADFDQRKDPHGGKCGMCHNPHEQKTPDAAANTCATAGCHSNWREEPFHSGDNHKQIGSKCLTCHLPHASKVDASNCQGCHEAVRERGPRRPPMPFDTAQALRRTHKVDAPIRVGVVRMEPPELRLAANDAASQSAGPRDSDAFRATFDPAPIAPLEYLAAGPPRPPPAARDSFSHSRHEKLACLVCHETGTGEGRLTFSPPRGCTICHHQAPSRSRCATCHQTAELTAALRATATVTVQGHPPKARAVEFRHSTHTKRACLECHTTPVTLAPTQAKAECRDCHDEHHAVGRSCASCHSQVNPAPAHKTLEEAHTRCASCHSPGTVARLIPTRNFCSTCHVPQSRNHFDNRECTSCHFLAEPGTYRPKLSTRARE